MSSPILSGLITPLMCEEEHNLWSSSCNCSVPYLHTGSSKFTLQVWGTVWHFMTCYVFTVSSCCHLAESGSWRTPLFGCPLLLLSIFKANFRICRRSPPSTTQGRAMPWWKVTHVTWRNIQKPLVQVIQGTIIRTGRSRHRITKRIKNLRVWNLVSRERGKI